MTQKRNSVKKPWLTPGLSSVNNFLNKELSVLSIKLKFYHFIIFSVLYHLIIMVPMFFELFQNDLEIKDVSFEQVVYLNFIEPVSQNNLNNDLTNENFLEKLKFKNKQDLLKTQKKKAKISKKKLNELSKNYEEKISQKIALVLEDIDTSSANVEGDYMVQFEVDKKGNITRIHLIQQSEDNNSNVELLKILNKIGTFDPIPEGFPELKRYNFQVPIYIGE